MLVNLCEISWHHISDDSNLKGHDRENLKKYNKFLFDCSVHHTLLSGTGVCCTKPIQLLYAAVVVMNVYLAV